MPEDTSAVLTERRDGVLLITLNRPDARNAVNGAVAAGVAAALDDLDASTTSRWACSPAPGRGSPPVWTSRRSPRASARGWRVGEEEDKRVRAPRFEQ